MQFPKYVLCVCDEAKHAKESMLGRRHGCFVKQGCQKKVCGLQVSLARQLLERNQKGLPIHKVPSG